MKSYKKIINIFAGIVIFISALSIIRDFNTNEFHSSYITQISIILTAIGLINFSSSAKYKWLRNLHYVIDYKTFVDRQKQIHELLSIVKGEKNIVNIFGINGIGVSETLRFTADLINKQLPLNTRIRYYKSLRAILPSNNIAFYFKITNINNQEHLVCELFQSMFVSNNQLYDFTFANFISLINQKVKHKHLILMFDEIRNTLQMTMLEEFMVRYLQARPQDTFFIGSHKKNLSYQFTCRFLEILRFNQEELYILTKAYNVHLKEEEQIKLYELSQGIPIYAYLLLRYYYIEKQLCKDNLIDYLHEKVFPSLNKREKDITSKLALISKQISNIEIRVLYKIIENFKSDELDALEYKALIEIDSQKKLFLCYQLLLIKRLSI